MTSDDRNRLIGDNIRKFRQLKGMTQEELVEGICSVSQLSKMENGKTYVQRTVLKQFADRLGVSVERLETEDALLDDLKDKLRLAQSALEVSRYDKCFLYLDEVLGKSRDHGYKEPYNHACAVKAKALLITQSYNETILFVKSVLEDFDGEKIQLVQMMCTLGQAYRMSGDLVAAYDAFKRAQDEFESDTRHADDVVRLQIYYDLAQCHGLLQSNPRVGLRYAEFAEKLALGLKKHLFRIRAGCMRGLFLRRLGETDEASRIYESLVYEAEANAHLLDVAIINHNLAHLCRERKQFGEAYGRLEHAISIYELLGENGYYLSALLEVAETALAEKDYVKTQKYVDLTFETIDRLDLPTSMEKAKCYILAAEIQKAKNSYETYSDFLIYALELYEGSNALVEAYDVASKIALFWHEQGNEQALDMYKRAVLLNQRAIDLGVRG